MEAQRVVVIQDASREVNSGAIRWALQGLSLKPGDKLTLLGVLRLESYQTFSYKDSRNLFTKAIYSSEFFLGNKRKMDSNFAANQKIADRVAENKKKEYENNVQVIHISKMYETQKVEFKIAVVTGASPKIVAVENAESLKATWVILDRQIKKYRKYFLEKLSCGISRMKSNNKIEKLRGPKGLNNNSSYKPKPHDSEVIYDEMVPGLPDQEDLFSIDISPSLSEQPDPASQVQGLTLSSGKEEKPGDWHAEEMFHSSMCRICKNRRPNQGWEKDFTFVELDSATNSFSPANCISEGGSAYAFRGQLNRNLKVIVKPYKILSSLGEINFNEEIRLLKKVRHKNVAVLLGSCTEGNLRLLVYEYGCNGSVSQHLSKHCPLPLTWSERMKVALGVARGLNCLHENNIHHRNLTTSNIVLNHDFEPMLGDFGFSIVDPDHSSQQKIDEELEHFARESTENRELSFRTDVYAFGIVLVELITGLRPTDRVCGGKILVGWARSLLKDRKHFEMVDPRIARACDERQLYWLCRITQKCLAENPKKRLNMDKVEIALEWITDKRACEVIEDISAIRSHLSYKRSDLSRLLSFDRRSERESFSSYLDENNQMGRSSSLTSSASFYARTSTSFSRSSVCSRLGNSERKISVTYGEMLN